MAWTETSSSAENWSESIHTTIDDTFDNIAYKFDAANVFFTSSRSGGWIEGSSSSENWSEE